MWHMMADAIEIKSWPLEDKTLPQISEKWWKENFIVGWE